MGIVLYTGYLSSLSFLADGKSQFYSPFTTFKAGFIAGTLQSLCAAPIDAVVTRFSVHDLLLHSPNPQSSWSYSLAQLKSMGFRTIFAGYPFNFVKESFGFGLFFSTFELVKGQIYNSYSTYIHNGPAVYPSFILLAGALAAVSVQSVQYPVGKLHKLYAMSCEVLSKTNSPEIGTRGAYAMTWKHAKKLCAKNNLGWWRWLYQGFVRATVATMPSTSIGLVVFEIFRIRYATIELDPRENTWNDGDRHVLEA